ncbi:lactonase family protein [Streptomyces sp. NPDC002054]|uniref:lactonase family protein n=1 Tax=Streptomyces sp. NPDC002054 TaxID=3154663 RepID=UPI0033319AB6
MTGREGRARVGQVQEGRVYIGSFTSAGGRGITTAAVDGRTGALTVLGSTDALPDPSYLARGPHRLYAVSEAEHGLVQAFALDAAGLPHPAGPPVPVAGAGPTHLGLAGSWLLTANYTSGSVSALPVRPDGTLGGPAAVLTHRGSGPDPERQQSPHAHQVLADPSGRWVLSVDLGTDSVRICAPVAPDPGAGAPSVHAEVRLPPGNGPRHLAFHASGALVYVLNELRPLLTVCRWDATAGFLEPVGEVPVAPEGAPGSARAYPSAIVASPDGRFLWAAVRGTDTIAVLATAGNPAEPQLTATVPVGGRWPRDLALDPSGQRLYAANERSGDVTWFAVDPQTGLPHRAGSVPVPAASCVLFG